MISTHNLQLICISNWEQIQHVNWTVLLNFYIKLITNNSSKNLKIIMMSLFEAWLVLVEQYRPMVYDVKKHSMPKIMDS